MQDLDQPQILETHKSATEPLQIQKEESKEENYVEQDFKLSDEYFAFKLH